MMTKCNWFFNIFSLRDAGPIRSVSGKLWEYCFPSGLQRRTFANTPNNTEPRPTPCSGDVPRVGLVVGIFNNPADPHNKDLYLTPTADRYNKSLDSRLLELIIQSGQTPRKNEVRIFYGLEQRFPAIAVVGLGADCMSYNEEEQLDENKEAIRQAVAIACRELQKRSAPESIFVESFGHAESAAEGAAMSLWSYQEYRKLEDRLTIPKLFLFDSCDQTGWQIGLHKAAAQNLARQLTEAPPNLLVPRTFAEHTVKLLNTSGINIEMKIKSWLKMVGMDSLLALGRGSCEDPILVEATYYGCEPDVCPVVLIGKGVTFDSGGLCLKSPEEMEHMRNDMAGAAIIIATMRAVAALQLPINIRALIPMCENTMGPRSLKPGDIIKTLKGETVRVEHANIQARLNIVDILSYADTYKPKFILDIGTLSAGIKEALGRAATGVWSNSEELWEQMRIASVHTGDRVWRFPLWNHFTQRVLWSHNADLKDVKTHLGSGNVAAAYLQRFLCRGDWIHIDINGVTMTDDNAIPYLREGFTGRPTRTVIEFLAQFACLQPDKKKTSNEQKCKMKTPECKN